MRKQRKIIILPYLPDFLDFAHLCGAIAANFHNPVFSEADKLKAGI